MLPIPDYLAAEGKACDDGHRFSGLAVGVLLEAGAPIRLGGSEHRDGLSRDAGYFPSGRLLGSVRRRGEDTAPYRGGS
jgi:hypothetical protein